MELNAETLAAIQQYYDNRKKHWEDKTPWDKQADLHAIDRASPGWRFNAAAGSFWFFTTTEKHHIMLYTYEGIWPLFSQEVKPLPKPEE
jgi:hypothetical protein